MSFTNRRPLEIYYDTTAEQLTSSSATTGSTTFGATYFYANEAVALKLHLYKVISAEGALGEYTPTTDMSAVYTLTLNVDDSQLADGETVPVLAYAYGQDGEYITEEDKGDIFTPSDFPLSTAVAIGDRYTVKADVTDDGGSAYTDTEQSFESGDCIVWLGEYWYVKEVPVPESGSVSCSSDEVKEYIQGLNTNYDWVGDRQNGYVHLAAEDTIEATSHNLKVGDAILAKKTGSETWPSASSFSPDTKYWVIEVVDSDNYKIASSPTSVDALNLGAGGFYWYKSFANSYKGRFSVRLNTTPDILKEDYSTPLSGTLVLSVVQGNDEIYAGAPQYNITNIFEIPIEVRKPPYLIAPGSTTPPDYVKQYYTAAVTQALVSTRTSKATGVGFESKIPIYTASGDIEPSIHTLTEVFEDLADTKFNELQDAVEDTSIDFGGYSVEFLNIGTYKVDGYMSIKCIYGEGSGSDYTAVDIPKIRTDSLELLSGSSLSLPNTSFSKGTFTDLDATSGTIDILSFGQATGNNIVSDTMEVSGAVIAELEASGVETNSISKPGGGSVHIEEIDSISIDTDDITSVTASIETLNIGTLGLISGSFFNLAPVETPYVKTEAIKEKEVGEGFDLEAVKNFIFKETSQLTISDGSVALSQSAHSIYGEGGSPDNLDTILGGTLGQLLVLIPYDPDVDIVLTTAGNIITEDGSTLDIPSYGYVMLYCTEVPGLPFDRYWRVIASSGDAGAKVKITAGDPYPDYLSRKIRAPLGMDMLEDASGSEEAVGMEAYSKFLQLSWDLNELATVVALNAIEDKVMVQKHSNSSPSLMTAQDFWNQAGYGTLSEVWVTGTSGYGSDATKVRVFGDTPLVDKGADINYVQVGQQDYVNPPNNKVDDGSYFEILTNGLYCITYSDNGTTDMAVGISKNAGPEEGIFDLAENIGDLDPDKRIAYTVASGDNWKEQVSVTLSLEVGDIIRPHTNGAITANADTVSFRITRLYQPLEVSGSGYIKNGANLGSGLGVFKERIGPNALYRSLVEGEGVSLSINSNDEIVISIDDYEYSGSGSGGDTFGFLRASTIDVDHLDVHTEIQTDVIEPMSESAIDMTDILVDSISERSGSNGVDLNDISNLILKEATDITISSGVIGITQSAHTISRVSALDDEISIINNGALGQLLLLSAEEPDNIITLINTGNIITPDSDDISIPPYGYIILYYTPVDIDGRPYENYWRVLSTSGGGSFEGAKVKAGPSDMYAEYLIDKLSGGTGLDVSLNTSGSISGPGGINQWVEILYELSELGTETSLDATADMVLCKIGSETVPKLMSAENFWNQAGFGRVSEIFVSGAAGFGSTETKIRKFANSPTVTGSDIAYHSDGYDVVTTGGACFEILSNGIYSITYMDNGDNDAAIGVSVNADTVLSEDIGDNAVNDYRIAYTVASGGNWKEHVSVTLVLETGDLVRPHTNGVPAASGNSVSFRITRLYAPRSATFTGASAALDNLGSVAINTSLLPGSTSTINLGSSTKTWKNLFLSNGSSPTADGQVNYNTSTNRFEFYENGSVVNLGSSPLNTKGDIYTYSTTDVKLSVGTNGQVLSSNSSETTGLEWIDVSGFGDVFKTGSPLDNQIAIWSDSSTIEGTSDFTYDGSNLQLTGDIGSTGTRITQGWFTDLTVSNSISGDITGNAATVSSLSGSTVGMALGSDAEGDIYYRSSTYLTRLGIGTASQVLVVNTGATAPEWVDLNAGSTCLYIDAGQLVPNFTNGPSAVNQEYASNDVQIEALDFDASIEESAQTKFIMPSNWDGEDTIQIEAIWSSAFSSGTASEVVRWKFRLSSRIDSDPLDSTFETAISVDDAFIAADDVHRTASTASITVNASNIEDLVILQVAREASHVNDTYSEDARLLGLYIRFNN